MQRFRLRACIILLYACLIANLNLFLTSSSALPKGNLLCSVTPEGYDLNFSRNNMSTEEQMQGKEDIELITVEEDNYDGVTVNVEKAMDSAQFATLLEASMSNWKQQGKKGVWIKLPLQYSNLVDSAVKAGFRYHHAEPDYLMLVYWIPDTPDNIPENASHRVGIGAFVVNNNREVLVVQEASGKFRGTGVWKMPTGVVNEGEDICTAAVREVKEETGIEAEFVEVLAFRQSHKSFFGKSDLFFLCMLQPHSFDIQSQASEIESAKWMPIEDVAGQPFVKENELFDFIWKICLSKLDGNYTGFSNLPTFTSTGKNTYLYLNTRDAKDLLASKNHQA